MQITKLLHNPSAGDQNHTEDELVKIIEKENFQCDYFSLKNEHWDEFSRDVDFLIVAGGDGSIRNTVLALLKNNAARKLLPIAVIPMGTANNIAVTLNISGTPESIVHSWHKKIIQKFDIGQIEGFEETGFFLESFGYGLFPRLMKEMKKVRKNEMNSTEKKITTALRLLLELTQDYESSYMEIFADEVRYSGKYLLVEVMNISSIGPNLCLAPNAEPGDGKMEVVMITEQQRRKFARYISNQILEIEDEFLFDTVKAEKIRIISTNKDAHADDEIVKTRKVTEISISMHDTKLEIMVPEITE